MLGNTLWEVDSRDYALGEEGTAKAREGL